MTEQRQIVVFPVINCEVGGERFVLNGDGAGESILREFPGVPAVKGSGFRDPDGFLAYTKNAFDVLYEEGGAGYPNLMTIGLHFRIVGRSSRSNALKEFMEYIEMKHRVRIATQTEIGEAFKEGYGPDACVA